MRSNLNFAFLFLLFLGVPYSGAVAASSFKMNEVTASYRDGDFEVVRSTLESALKKDLVKGIDARPLTREERVFAYKHLGVIYAANPQDEGRAKNMFIKALEISPRLEIMDLYPSDRIHALFAKARSDLNKEQEYQRGYDALGNPKTAEKGPIPMPMPNSSKANSDDSKNGGNKRSHAWMGWTAAGGAYEY